MRTMHQHQAPSVSQLRTSVKVQLVGELEKRFAGQHVLLVAQRKIEDKEKHSNRKASKGQVRRPLTALTAFTGPEYCYHTKCADGVQHCLMLLMRWWVHSLLQVRPRSRTLTSVHEAILDDLVFPANICGKRTRHALDANKQICTQIVV